MRILRFRCIDCDMEMMLHTRPDCCPSCGSNAVIREGWRQRAKLRLRFSEECDKE